MSDIPRGRRRLEILAQQLDLTHPGFGYGALIHTIIDDYLVRERPIRQAPVKNRRVTARLRDAVARYAHAHPARHMSEVGEAFGINQGRVSEILNGKWDHL